MKKGLLTLVAGLVFGFSAAVIVSCVCADQMMGDAPLAQNAVMGPMAASSSPEAVEAAIEFRDPFETCLPPKAPQVEVYGGPPVNELTGVVEGAPSEFDAASFKITGLIWGTDKPQAIINEKVVGIGDFIKDAQIKNITKEGVLVKFKEREFLLKRGMTDSGVPAGSPAPMGGQSV